MMNYRKITHKLLGKVSLNNAYLYYCMLFKSDFKSYECNATRETLGNLTGTKYLDTITKATQQFKDDDLIDRIDVSRDENGHTRNKYYLNTDNYEYITDKLITMPIKKQLKGFIILLKLCCLDRTNFTQYNISKLTEVIGIHRNYISKYLKEAIALGIVRKTDKGYEFTDESISIIDNRCQSEFEKTKCLEEEILTDEELLTHKVNNNG